MAAAHYISCRWLVPGCRDTRDGVLSLAQAQAGCCHPGASLVPCPAGTWGRGARAGSTVLTTTASLNNSSYSHQYLFAQ